VAGKGPKGFSASVTTGEPERFIGPKELRRPESVQTLDGCLMLVQTDRFIDRPFDETTADGWYLYIADYCLDLARRGESCYVLPHRVFHESTGPANPELYAETLARIIAKHQDRIETLYTTIGEWKTR
jgi:hypothetical protein